MTATAAPAVSDGPSVQERAELLELVRSLAEREIAPRAALLDTDPAFADEAADEAADDARARCWQQLSTAGLDGLLAADPAGGLLLTAVEELAVADGGTALAVLLASLAGSVTQLPGDGGRWALVPAGAAVAADGGTLTGRVGCALGAWDAHGLVLLAGNSPRPRAYLLPAGTAGLTVERDTRQLGLRGAPAAILTLREVRADELRPVGDELPALLAAGVAAVSRGVARRGCQLALDYARLRLQGGVPIIEHDAVADLLAAMAVRLAAGSAPVPPASLAQALAAKIAASEAALATARDAVQVFGGTGYMCDTGVEKLMRDAKYCQLFPEPNWAAVGALLAAERG